jgi:hypothetical protein
MPVTYTPIATQTLGSAAATVTFSSIAGTYTDLLLISNNKLAGGTTAGFWLQFNSDTASNYSDTYFYGDGTTAASGRASNQTKMFIGNTNATDFNTQTVSIQNYSNSTTYKTALGRAAVPANYTIAYVGLWRSTSAITSIVIGNDAAQNFAIGSTFTLYGIKAA